MCCLVDKGRLYWLEDRYIASVLLYNHSPIYTARVSLLAAPADISSLCCGVNLGMG